ncbi:MAG: LysR substrate-binding domain-containing protein, partial [Cyanobacteria bacterium P01_D01_bin.56]
LHLSFYFGRIGHGPIALEQPIFSRYPIYQRYGCYKILIPKVIAPIALGQLYLLDMAIQFQQQYPLISLSWYLEDRPIRFVEVGCDCWIKIGPVTDESLTVEPLGQVERLVVAAPKLLMAHGKPKTPKALEQLPFIALEPFEGKKIPLINGQNKTTHLLPTAQLVTNNISALHRAALAGVGAAVMPRWLIEQDLSCHRLIDILPKWRAPKLTIHVASLPGRHRPYRLRRFLEVLKQTVPTIPGIETV